MIKLTKSPKSHNKWDKHTIDLNSIIWLSYSFAHSKIDHIKPSTVPCNSDAVSWTRVSWMRPSTLFGRCGRKTSFVRPRECFGNHRESIQGRSESEQEPASYRSKLPGNQYCCKVWYWLFKETCLRQVLRLKISSKVHLNVESCFNFKRKVSSSQAFNIRNLPQLQSLRNLFFLAKGGTFRGPWLGDREGKDCGHKSGWPWRPCCCTPRWSRPVNCNILLDQSVRNWNIKINASNRPISTLEIIKLSFFCEIYNSETFFKD